MRYCKSNHGISEEGCHTVYSGTNATVVVDPDVFAIGEGAVCNGGCGITLCVCSISHIECHNSPTFLKVGMSCTDV